MRIHIQAIQFTASDQLIEFIEKKTAKLEHFYDRIIDVEVYLTLDNKSSHIKDKVVRIKLNLPQVQLVASESNKTFEPAVDSAIDSITRQLKRYKEKLRGQ
ncbi:MAG: ribosome hibernation-promoting factor, HPF/YfiA family [Chitinophagales bacterium]